MYRLRLESLDHQSPMARNASWLIIIYLDLLGLTLLAAISTSAFFLESLFAFLWNRICDFNEWDLLSPLDKAKGGILLGPLPEITYFWFRQICDYNLLKKSPLLVSSKPFLALSLCIVSSLLLTVFWEKMLRKQFYPLQNVKRDLVSQICQNWQASCPQRPSQWRACGTPNRLPPRPWTKGNLHGWKFTTNLHL